MAFITYFMVTVAFLVGIAVISFVIYERMKHTKGKKEKIIIALDTSKTNGHVVVLQTREEKPGFGSNPHRYYIPAFPSDEEKANSELVMNEDDYYTWDDFAPGSLDLHLPITISYPRNIARLPEAVKQTTLGQALMLTLSMKGSEADVVEAMKKGGERARDIMEKINKGEFSKELTEKNQRMVQDYSDAVVERLKKLYPQLEPSKKQEVKKEFN